MTLVATKADSREVAELHTAMDDDRDTVGKLTVRVGRLEKFVWGATGALLVVEAALKWWPHVP